MRHPEESAAADRKTWEKPEVRVIELTAEEVLAVGCKQPAAGYAYGLPSCGLGLPCVQKGS